MTVWKSGFWGAARIAWRVRPERVFFFRPPRSLLSSRRHSLDAIVNNACQTIRRPRAYYAHMLEGEASGLHAAAEAIGALLGGGGQEDSIFLHCVLPDWGSQIISARPQTRGGMASHAIATCADG